MIEDVVKVLIKKIISSDYPYLKMPSVVFAKISSAKICGTYEVNDLTITNKKRQSRHFRHRLLLTLLNTACR